jgi:hypothetical protein
MAAPHPPVPRHPGNIPIFVNLTMQCHDVRAALVELTRSRVRLTQLAQHNSKGAHAMVRELQCVRLGAGEPHGKGSSCAH